MTYLWRRIWYLWTGREYESFEAWEDRYYKQWERYKRYGDLS